MQQGFFCNPRGFFSVRSQPTGSVYGKNVEVDCGSCESDLAESGH